MEHQSLVVAIGKLAIAGQQAGFSLEQVIQLLDAGLSVESLIELIAWRFESHGQSAVSSNWAV